MVERLSDRVRGGGEEESRPGLPISVEGRNESEFMYLYIEARRQKEGEQDDDDGGEDERASLSQSPKH